MSGFPSFSEVGLQARCTASDWHRAATSFTVLGGHTSRAARTDEQRGSYRFLKRAQVEPPEPERVARDVRGAVRTHDLGANDPRRTPVFRTRIFFSRPEKRPESFDFISEFEKLSRQRWTGERLSNGSLTDFRYERGFANTNSEFSVCPPDVEKKNAVATPPPVLITSPAVAFAALFVVPVSDDFPP